MKNIKKKKTKVKKDKLTFPKQLVREELFKCPIWSTKEPAFVDELNKASDSYIEAAKKNLKKIQIREIRNMVIKVIWVMYFTLQL